MMRVLPLLLALSAWPAAAESDASSGLVTKKSGHPVGVTLDRLESIVRDKGFTVFARIDHAAGAAAAGETLRPTELLIFGNPKIGSALMSSSQSAGIDLPVRVAAWQDADGQVWIGYTAPRALAQRHGIADRGAVVDKMTGALDALTDAASR